MLKFLSAAIRLFRLSARQRKFRPTHRLANRRRGVASARLGQLHSCSLKSQQFQGYTAVRRSWSGRKGSLSRVCQSRRTRAMLQCEPPRDVAASAIREVTFTSGGSGGVMELGLLSNSALNPSVYWTTLLPPLFSGTGPPARRPDDRSSAPRVGAPQRVGQGSLPGEGLRRAVLDPARRASQRSDSPRLVPEPGRSPIQFRPRRVEAFVDQDRARRDGRTSRSVFCRLSRGDGGAYAAISAGEICLAAVRRGHRRFLPAQGTKSIFAFWLGRRYEPLHQALLAYCETRGLRYVYSKDGGLTTEEIGQLASSAQYFVATPPDLDDPKRTGGFSPLVMRYFEGLAAGTRILGVMPRSGEYKSILPTDAFCQVSPDGSDLARRLDEDRSNPDNQRAVDAACAFVREHHSWRRRAEQVFNHLANGAAIEFPTIKRSAKSIARPAGLVFGKTWRTS